MKGTWGTLATTLTIQAMVSMALLTLPVMAPVVALALGISAAWTGLYVAMVYAGAMASSLAAGAAVARFGAIRVSQAGLVMCAAGLGFCAIPSMAATALGALLIGLGYGPVTPASSHLLARTTPGHRISLVFSIKQTGVPLGGVLAGAIVPSLLLVAGWQGALLAAAAANLLCALAAQPLRRALDADRTPGLPLVPGNLAQPIKLVLSHPGLMMLAGCSFFFSAAQLSLTSYLVIHLHQTLAYGLVAAGFALSLAQAGGVAGRILWGWVSDRRLGARRMLAVLAGLMAASSLATALLQPAMPIVLVLAILVVFGATAIGWNGVYLAEVALQAPPGKASIATGGTLAITYFGVVLGPSMFGAVSGLFDSYRAGYAALSIPIALCGLALLRARRMVQARPPAG
jgi:MFS family permease